MGRLPTCHYHLPTLFYRSRGEAGSERVDVLVFHCAFAPTYTSLPWSEPRETNVVFNWRLSSHKDYGWSCHLLTMAGPSRHPPPSVKHLCQYIARNPDPRTSF